ncbi:cysteine desulfurase family protein [Brochothrix thermosphacta]|uniref:cysteine desulfurase family protein n=1 Tax=Brochothrix thermosphacta TaxID=2756 RepID=UPI0003E84B43|nr:cysteine desulfurase family protein [Brochothrix thermosphacta]EUJ35256.1 class V aminotransferase [Brochothrix thermosphacta DSM 20171 = FSL F6-1036]ODJ49503.1 cysteine desulfurase NifS [Brochothrix thermosphacta DSM 20171 = FSL F6-1036]
MKQLYIDHAATSPIDPEVMSAMVDNMLSISGNPSSVHRYGREARYALDTARAVLAASIHAKESEIVFTSGGTESDNLALLGTAYARQSEGKHIITTAIEHSAILKTAQALEKDGFEITYLPVSKNGEISLNDLQEALRPDTILVSIMYGNNEVGSRQPIQAIGLMLETHPSYFHTDAVQAYGLEKLNVDELKVDLLSTSAHKLNGPHGIGFLYVRSQIRLNYTMFGGDQERKRRAGTENLPAIVGYAKAVELAEETRADKRDSYEKFKQIIISALDIAGVKYEINGTIDNSLSHILNIHFIGASVEAFLVNLDMAGVAVSSGSACMAGSIEPSHVLVAMYGEDTPVLKESLRFSFGAGLTKEDITYVADETVRIYQRIVK